MKIRRASVGAWLSAGAIALAGCSSDSDSSNAPLDDGGADGSVASGGQSAGSGGKGSGGKGSGGKGSGGTGTGGKGTGGAATGGSGTGGDDSGAGTGGDDSGTGSGGTDSGAPEAGPDGATAAGGAGAGGAGAGGAGTGGAGTGGAGTGGAGTGGAGTGGAGTGGSSSGGSSSIDAGPDATSSMDGGGDASDGGSTAAHMRVFVTTATFSGDLETEGAGTSGLNGADKLCQAAADAESLGGTWVAWLSDSNTDAIDRINDVGPWYRIDDVKVFDNKAALTGNPLVAINVGEDGSAVNFLPWTGTKADGTKDAATCVDWTSAIVTDSGMCGSSSSVLTTWTESSALPCSIPYNLYCFEQ